MKITITEADETKIQELANASAFTWEGMNLDEENLVAIAQAFIEESLVKTDTEEIQGFTWSGDTMNKLYNLHGENKYPDNLPFLSFSLDTFNGTGNLNVFKFAVGARWLDDIIRNNELNEEENVM